MFNINLRFLPREWYQISVHTGLFIVALALADSSMALPRNDIELDPPIPDAPPSSDPEDQEPGVPALSSALSAIVIDFNTGEVLGAKSPDARRPMASTTKIMTALLVLEQISKGVLSLDTIVSISQWAGTMGDGTDDQRSFGSVMGDRDGGSVGLSPGDTVSINDLLYGLLLDSGNDAAVALAEAVAGSEQAFVDMMNDRGIQLNLTNTRFANPHGRDPQKVDKDYCDCADWRDLRCQHYSSARDLATLASVAMTEPLFAMIVNTAFYRTQTWISRMPDSVDMGLETSNLLVRPNTDFTYPGAFGVKTGTTDLAGFCLVSAADSLSNGSHSVLVVVLGTANNDDRYNDSALLLDYGLDVLEQRDPPSQFNYQVQVPSGINDKFY